MRILRRRHGSYHAYYLARAEDLEGYVRAEIDNKTFAVGFFDRVYPRLRDSIGKLGLSSSQQLHFRIKNWNHEIGAWESREMCLDFQKCMRPVWFGGPTAITHLKEYPD